MLSTPRKEDICYATQNRQDAVKKLLEECDVLIVVGSRSSSNSNRLRELADRVGGIPAGRVDVGRRRLLRGSRAGEAGENRGERDQCGSRLSPG